MRLDDWSPARQAGFIQSLETCGSVAAAAEAVGMTEGSAYRLRRHPEAEGFRRAWAVAVKRTWQRVEQVALERVIQGEIEVIEREGQVVMTRRRPCSDRLMIYMLQHQLRQRELEIEAFRAEREAFELANSRRDEAQRRPPPLDAEASETRQLRDMQACIEALPDSHGWDTRVLAATSDHDGPVPPLPSPPKLLAPASGRLAVRGKPARLRDDAAPRKARNSGDTADLSARTGGDKPAFVPHPYNPDIGIGGGSGAYREQ